MLFLVRLCLVLGPLATNTASKLDVLWHDSHSLGVNGSQVGVLKESDKIGLSSLLKSQHSAGLEAQVGLEVLSDFANKPLERQLADEQLCRLLVLANLAQGDGSRAVSAIEVLTLVPQRSFCLRGR